MSIEYDPLWMLVHLHRLSELHCWEEEKILQWLLDIPIGTEDGVRQTWRLLDDYLGLPPRTTYNENYGDIAKRVQDHLKRHKRATSIQSSDTRSNGRDAYVCG